MLAAVYGETSEASQALAIQGAATRGYNGRIFVSTMGTRSYEEETVTHIYYKPTLRKSYGTHIVCLAFRLAFTETPTPTIPLAEYETNMMYIQSILRTCQVVTVEEGCVPDANYVTCYSYCPDNLCNDEVHGIRTAFALSY